MVWTLLVYAGGLVLGGWIGWSLAHMKHHGFMARGWGRLAGLTSEGKYPHTVHDVRHAFGSTEWEQYSAREAIGEAFR